MIRVAVLPLQNTQAETVLASDSGPGRCRTDSHLTRDGQRDGRPPRIGKRAPRGTGGLRAAITPSIIGTPEPSPLPLDDRLTAGVVTPRGGVQWSRPEDTARDKKNPAVAGRCGCAWRVPPSLSAYSATSFARCRSRRTCRRSSPHRAAWRASGFRETDDW